MADESGDYEVQELDPRVFQVPEFLPGQKVQITIGSTTKHAEVRFVGPLTGMKGFWLGVQYEDKASRDPPSLTHTHTAPPAEAPLLAPHRPPANIFPQSGVPQLSALLAPHECKANA